MKQKPFIKIVLTNRSEDNTVLSFKFQDANISLKELISAEYPGAKFLLLGALLEEKELNIADPVQIANA